MGLTSLRQRGIDCALDAYRAALLTDTQLEAVLAWYRGEGVVDGADVPTPVQVLERLAGVPADVLLRHGIGGDEDPSQAAPAGAASPEPGWLSGRFQRLTLAGEGAMGQVWRAWDRDLAREVALKVIRPERLAGPSRERQLARFEREARAMAKVRHPACVTVYEAGVQRGSPFLVMEFVEGVSLGEEQARRREAGERLDARTVARWGQQVAEGLQACHEAGIVHRDVKPDNLILTPSGQVKLADFGVARAAEERRLTRDGAMVGSPAFMAPEQSRGGQADARSDVFALGATLLELLTGVSALELRGEARAGSGRLPVVRRLRPDVPPDLEGVLARCLESDPDRRYPTAQALALDLARFQAGVPVRARRGGPARAARALWRHRVPVGLFALALAAPLAAASGWSARRQRQRVRAASQALERAEAEAAAVLAGSPGAGPEERERELGYLEERLVQHAGDPALTGLRDRLRGVVGRIRAARHVLAADQALAGYRAAQGREDGLQGGGAATQRVDDAARRRATNEVRSAFEAADRLLEQAEAALPVPGVFDRRAELYAIRGAALARRDPAAAERLLAAAARWDLLAGGPRAGSLALPSLDAAGPEGATVRLLRYRADAASGRLEAAEVEAAPSPAAWPSLAPGAYRVEVEAPGRLGAALPLLLRRGEHRRVALQPPRRARLGLLADALVFVAAGRPRQGRDLAPAEVRVGPFLLGRAEVTAALWALLRAQDPTARDGRPVRTPGSGPSPAGEGAVAPAPAEALAEALVARSVPVARTGPRDAAQLLSWLTSACNAQGVAGRARLPSPGELHWALRGELPWSFPWGEAPPPPPGGERRPAGTNLVDVSPFGARDLVGSIAELTNEARAGAVRVFGAGEDLPAGALRAVARECRWVRRPEEQPTVGLRFVWELPAE